MDFAAPPQLQQFDPVGSLLRGSNAAAQIQENAIAPQMRQLQLEQLRMALGKQRMINDFAGRILGAGNQNQGTPTGGIQNGPQSSVSQPTQSGSTYAPPNENNSGGMTLDPRSAFAVEMLTSGDVTKGLAAQAAAMKDNQERLKIQNQPQVDMLRMAATSPNPGALVMNNPSLMAAWHQNAPRFGIDPSNPQNLTPENLRMVMTFGHNTTTAQYGGDQLQMPGQVEQIKGYNGQQLSHNVVTGDVKQEVAPQELKTVIENGRPKYVLASDAVGKEPFNPSIFGAANLSNNALELGYQQYANTGQMPSFGRNPAMQAKMLDYIAKRSSDDFGPNATATIIARGQQTKAQGAVVKDFESGQTAKTLNGLNTAIKHMDTMETAVVALQNGNIQVLNKLGNFFGTQLGNDPANNFNIVKNFAAGEVAKAVLPQGGGEREREEISRAINSANSPQQLHSALALWRELLAGKTDALRNQWDTGTNGNHGNFDRFLLPETKRALGIKDGNGGGGNAPQAAIDYLKAHPDQADAFKAKYGYLPNG